jgi:hypothetical protein
MGELLCLVCKCHIDWCDCPDPDYVDEDDLDEEELEYFEKDDDPVTETFWDWMSTDDDD